MNQSKTFRNATLKWKHLRLEISTEQLSSALEFLKAYPSSEIGRDLSLRLLQRWAGEDAQAAADWAGDLPDSFRQDAVNGVVAVWANRDFSGAVEWARQLSGDKERAATLMAIAYEAGRTQPIEALRLSSEIAATESRNDLVAHIVSQWASSAPENAAEWASQIEDVKLRERITAEVAIAWGNENPLAAATLAVKSLPPGRQMDDAVVSIVAHWAQTNPIEAAAWIVNFPEGNLRDTASSELVKLWADKNSEQAGEWINGLNPGNNRDLVTETYASKLAPQFPKQAIQWAEKIADNAIRQRGMELVAEIWLSNEAVAATEWIEQSTLDEAAKNRLLHPR